MKKFLGYMLSPRKFWQSLQRHRLHKMMQVGERPYLMALARYHHQYFEPLSTSAMKQVAFNVHTNDIGELGALVTDLHHCITTTDANEKYFRSHPVFYSGTPTRQTLLEYAEEAGYFVDPNQRIITLLVQLKEIDHALTLEFNAEMLSYYDNKAKRLHQELIRVLEALL